MGSATSLLVSVGLLAYGLGGVWLGVRLRGGREQGLLVFALLTTCLGVAAVIHAARRGHGWYEATIFAFILMDILFVRGELREGA